MDDGDARKRQHRTFYLLGCERCARFEPPPKRLACRVAAPATEPMRCAECGELLLLVEAFVAPQTEMWQRQPGTMWHHVVFPELLPDRDGRQVWI